VFDGVTVKAILSLDQEHFQPRRGGSEVRVVWRAEGMPRA